MRDIDIRRALRAHVQDSGNNQNALVIDELDLCQGRARVDLAVVNGSLHGYEIKSEHDTLARLPNQCDAYGLALEFVTVVTTTHHAANVLDSVPPWWGVWSAAPSLCEGVEFVELREPQRNPSIDPVSVAAFLWRDEALEELERRGIASGIRSKSRRSMWEKLAETLSSAELCAVVRERLKQRTRWRAPLSRTPNGGRFRLSAT